MGDNIIVPVPQVTVSHSENHDNEEIGATPTDEELYYTYKGKGLLRIDDGGGKIRLGPLLRKYYIEGEDEEYWTLALLRHIITEDRARAELAEHQFDLDAQNGLIEKIFPPVYDTETASYLYIFTLLVLVEKVQCLPDFVDGQRGICDKDLPVIFRGRRSGRPLRSEGDRSRRLDCFESWTDPQRESFERDQWKIIVPFFDVTKEDVCKEFVMHSKSRRPWRNSKQAGTGIGPINNAGGFGAVSRVEFHPTCHSFHRVLTEINLEVSEFAIKTLYNIEFNNKPQYRRELDQLRRFRGAVHPHLVTTLGSFERESRWNFIFPSAQCDLDEYLDTPRPMWNLNTVRWASEQLLGLMGALDTIHNPKHLHANSDMEKKYGRHGDIKCDNILCFRDAVTPSQYNLVISDFGLSGFHRDTSRSNIPNQDIPAVPGYRPPECDIKGGLISRAYDIWTIGCLFLEFLTWLLGGDKLLQEFRKKRETPYITGSNNDIFFVLKTYKQTRGYVAQVKPEVTQWIQHLRSLKDCSRFVHDVLDLIEAEMLVVLASNAELPSRERRLSGIRTSSGELKNKFESIKLQCSKGADYCTKGIPEEYQEPALAQAVEAKLNNVATRLIADHDIRLDDYEGDAKEPMLPDQFKKIE